MLASNRQREPLILIFLQTHPFGLDNTPPSNRCPILRTFYLKKGIRRHWVLYGHLQGIFLLTGLKCSGSLGGNQFWRFWKLSRLYVFGECINSWVDGWRLIAVILLLCHTRGCAFSCRSLCDRSMSFRGGSEIGGAVLDTMAFCLLPIFIHCCPRVLFAKVGLTNPGHVVLNTLVICP